MRSLVHSKNLLYLCSRNETNSILYHQEQRRTESGNQQPRGENNQTARRQSKRRDKGHSPWVQNSRRMARERDLLQRHMRTSCQPYQKRAVHAGRKNIPTADQQRSEQSARRHRRIQCKNMGSYRAERL